MAQLFVIVDVLVAQRDPEHLLPNRRRNKMLDQLRSPAVNEALRKTLRQTDRMIRRSKHHCPGIRGDGSAIESGHNCTPSYGCKLEQFCVTLCGHRGAPRIGKKSFSKNNFR
ncbi:MAG: hypothetical protein ACREDV_12825 [Methylocella sp.]